MIIQVLAGSKRLMEMILENIFESIPQVI